MNIYIYILVGGLEHFLFFHSVGNVIIPTDFNSIIFQRGRVQTTNQIIIHVYSMYIYIYVYDIYMYIYIYVYVYIYIYQHDWISMARDG